MLGACNRCRASVWRSFCSLVTSSWGWPKRFTRSTKPGLWAMCFTASSGSWASRRWFARRSLWKQAASRKHNKIDASKLAGRLYNYLGGDRYALRIVRVPSPEQEQLRARSRQHDQLVRSRKALGAQGRSLMLTQGYGINGSWWRPKTFDKLRVLLPERMSQELAVWQSSLLLLDQQIALLKTELGQSLHGPRPKGFGALSLTQLD